MQNGVELYYDDHGYYPKVSDWIKIEDTTTGGEANTFNNEMRKYMADRLKDPLYIDLASDYSYRYSSISLTDGTGYKACVLLEKLYELFCIYSSSGSNIDISSLPGG